MPNPDKPELRMECGYTLIWQNKNGLENTSYFDFKPIMYRLDFKPVTM